MAYRAATALVAVTLALAAASAGAARVAPDPTLRVMLHPDAAARFTLSQATQARLEAIAGAPLAWHSTTRTGALELSVAGPRSAAEMEAIARRLRNDRSVLWVQGNGRSVVNYGNRSPQEAQVPSRRMMVRLSEDAQVDWPTLLPRLSERVGRSLTVERAIGNIWVLSLPTAVPTVEMEAIAEALQQDPSVLHADPVRRLRAMAVPDDPYFADQWSLVDAVSGINLQAAWELGPGRAPVTVAVIDTGILDHPDLFGRLLPGYDFISSTDDARDGDSRDADPRDEGDWKADGDCSGMPAQPSFWHGLFVTGIVAANANNGIGIAGIAESAKIVPVRALGRCGGSDDDLYAALLWAVGAPVPGAPANPNPARVVNLSLGGFGSCPAALQEAIDEALAQGTVIIAAAGNETDDAQNYAPGNCGGVITVGATNHVGDRTYYSNFGRRIDLSAPGGEGARPGLIISTFDAGTEGPAEASYAYAAGTSFAAPMVTGTASLMLSRNPNLTASQVLSILQGSTREFPPGSACGIGGFCGVGLLDAGTAVGSTVPAAAALPPGAIPVVEYYDAALDHYTVSADAATSAQFDASDRWQRTGHVFYAYADAADAPVAVLPVCRFYNADVLVDSYFFTADPVECNYLAQNASTQWMLENDHAFFIEVPDAAGQCRPGTIPVYRFFNNRQDASQRFTIDLSVKRAMINRAWVADGPGAKGAAFCSAI